MSYWRHLELRLLPLITCSNWWAGLKRPWYRSRCWSSAEVVFRHTMTLYWDEIWNEPFGNFVAINYCLLLLSSSVVCYSCSVSFVSFLTEKQWARPVLPPCGQLIQKPQYKVLRNSPSASVSLCLEKMCYMLTVHAYRAADEIRPWHCTHILTYE